MAEFLLVAAMLVLLMTAAGLVRLLRGPGDADRMMAGQLLGTGGIAVLLLASAISEPAIADAALTRLEVDARGLDAFDRRYLTLIAENFSGGPVGIETGE